MSEVKILVEELKKEVKHYAVPNITSTELAMLLESYQALERKLEIAVETLGMVDHVGLPDPYAAYVRKALEQIKGK